MREARILVGLLVVALCLGGCTHDRYGPPSQHFAEFKVAPPDGKSVEVCRAYTCAMKTTFYFHQQYINQLAALMR